MTLRNQTIDDALAEARDHYGAKRPKSRVAHEAATKVMPGGNTRTTLFHGPFPLRIDHGRDATLTDVDGFAYKNFLGEYTAGVFGHSHPVIRKAIDRALDAGMSFGAQTANETELARLVCERFKSIEKVRFTNSGTEGNLMAVSTARHVTGRSKVMVMKGGYHGGVFYFAGGGSPVNAPYPFVFGRYNDIDATRAEIRAHAADLACLLIEPMTGSGGCFPCDPAFLAMLRTETRACGAILIFDEVMTSRLGRGGAQSLYDVTPDMTTLGKWIGGGMSFGAFGGRADLMDLYDPGKPNHLPHAGTFNNNVLTMSAGVAAMSEVFTADVAEQLHARGDGLRNQLNALFARKDVAMQATGLGSMIHLHPTAKALQRPSDLAGVDDRVRDLLFFDLIERGIYVGRRGFIALTLALTDRDLDGFVEAMGDIVTARRGVLARRTGPAAV